MATKLSLGKIKEIVGKKNGKAYKQPILYDSGRLAFMTNKFTFHNGGLITRFHDNNQMSCLVPIDDWNRSQLNVIQNFVMNNLTIPKDLASTYEKPADAFKPLYEGANLFIPVAPWCRFFEVKPDIALPIEVKSPASFGLGKYQVKVIIPHVYMGHHANDKLCSISMSVTEMYYEEDKEANKEFCIMDFVDDEGEKELLSSRDDIKSNAEDGASA